MTNLQNLSHRRWNPLLREWVLVSPHRTQRPWQGRVENPPEEARLAYDPGCYLCPGNGRAGGARNPPYRGTFVFDNDYPALLPDPPAMALKEDNEDEDESGLIAAHAEAGVCRVLCFSPRHDLTVPRMTPLELRAMVDLWVEQYQELGGLPWINHVQIFENRGAMMGASNPHPHGQVWATASLPNQAVQEQRSFQEYHERRNACLLCGYLRLELERQERVICENDAFVVLAPFWGVWPYETLLLSRIHRTGMDAMPDHERDALGDILRRLTTRYDNLFEVPFPYSMGFHQRPTDGQPHPEWHWHAHYYPPLLRSATVQKFMVGYEMLAAPQRDITPEAAAARMREAGELHYLDRP